MIISYLEYLEIPPRHWHSFFYDSQDNRWKGYGMWRGEEEWTQKLKLV